MTKPPEARPVFDPASVPRPRSARAKGVSVRCCFFSAVAVCAAVVLFGLVFLAKIATDIAHNLASPHPDLQAESADLNVVKPLINSTSRFDILATVWLDVTQHLAAGKDLPEDSRLVTYKSPDGIERSEMVLYSDRIVSNTTMATRTHGKAQIRVPIEPLYSQQIGPSSLRATFKIEPHDVDVRLNFSQAIYPSELPIGPRSPVSPLLTESRLSNGSWSAKTLSEALEHSSVNANLLTLLPSKWRVTDAVANVRERRAGDLLDAHFDKSAANTAFARGEGSFKSGLQSYFDTEQTLMVPHMLTRTRLVLVKEERSLKVEEYLKRRKQVVNRYTSTCQASLSSSKEMQTANDALPHPCARQSQISLFENFIGMGSDSELFYAPFLLIPPRTAVAPRHHRSMPLVRPDKPIVNEKWQDCLIPMLQTDDTNSFFLLDWDVSFSSHNHIRATAPGSVLIAHHSPTSKNTSMADLPLAPRISIEQTEDIEWETQAYGFGDREHSKSRPTLMLLSSVGDVFIAFLTLMLTPFYWYTRVTTRGLSQRGQWLLFASHCLLIWVRFPTTWQFSLESFGSVVLILLLLAPLPLQLGVLLRLDRSRGVRLRRRPADGPERLTDRLDARLSWIAPVSLFVLFALYIRYVEPEEVILKAAHGCLHPGELNQQRTLQQLVYALSRAGQVLQMWHNAQSGLFAGDFKLTVLVDFVYTLFAATVQHVEFVGGWQASRLPISLQNVENWAFCAATFLQAMSLPGVRQELEGDVDD